MTQNLQSELDIVRRCRNAVLPTDVFTKMNCPMAEVPRVFPAFGKTGLISSLGFRTDEWKEDQILHRAPIIREIPFIAPRVDGDLRTLRPSLMIAPVAACCS